MALVALVSVGGTSNGSAAANGLTDEAAAADPVEVASGALPRRNPPTQIHTVTASAGERSVDVRVIGEPRRDPMFVVDIVAHDSEDDLFVAVVSAVSNVAVIQLVGPSGDVLDRVRFEERPVALAAPGGRATVQALDADGDVVGSCPPQGVTIDAVTYQCTFAPGVMPPVTTTMTVPVP